MTLPDYQGFMNPILAICQDGLLYSRKELAEKAADLLHLTEDDKQVLTNKGIKTKVQDRVHWAAYYLKRAECLEIPERGLFKITPRGMELFQSQDVVNKKRLEVYDEFREFLGAIKKENTFSDKNTVAEVYIPIEEKTPDEIIQSAYQELRRSLADDLLERLRQVSPRRFEFIVGEVLEKMGYGSFEATRYSNDGGIDGILKEDSLGMGLIGLQAKRYKAGSTVGRDAIASFSGSLGPIRTKKGVFITTSSFTKEAYKQAEQDDRKIILVSGEQFAQLMIEHGVGVSAVDTYTLYRPNSDYFDDI